MEDSSVEKISTQISKGQDGWMQQAELLYFLQRSVTDKLQTRVESLLEERNKLQSSVKDLRVSLRACTFN